MFRNIFKGTPSKKQEHPIEDTETAVEEDEEQEEREPSPESEVGDKLREVEAECEDLRGLVEVKNQQIEGVTEMIRKWKEQVARQTEEKNNIVAMNTALMEQNKEASAELAGLREAHSAMLEDYQNMTTAHNRAAFKYEELERGTLALQEAHKSLSRKHQALKEQGEQGRSEISMQLQTAMVEVERLSELLRDALQKNSSLAEELAVVQKQMYELLDDNAALNAQNADAMEKLTAARQSLDQGAARRQSLTTDHSFEELNTSLSPNKAPLSKSAKSEEEVSKLICTVGALTIDNENLIAQAKEAEETIDQLMDTQRTMEAHTITVQGDMEALMRMGEARIAELDALAEAKTNLERQAGDLRADNMYLQEECMALQSELDCAGGMGMGMLFSSLAIGGIIGAGAMFMLK